MVSPVLSKTKNESLSVAYNIRKLFQVIYKKQEQEEEDVNEDEARIKVSDIISKMAFFYEKIRNYVDYNEEHLHMKNAIARILKRLIMIEGAIKITQGEEISRQLIHELIRAGYLPNDKVPESKIDEVNEILEKNNKLRSEINPNYSIGKQVETMISKNKRKREEWLIKIMASEIESILAKDRVKEMVVSNIYEILTENIKLPSNFLKHEKDLKIQIYLSIHRTFLKFDRDMLSFILFKYYNSSWWMPKDDDISSIASNIDELNKEMDRQLDHPLARQLDKIVNKYTVYYMVLLDMITKDPTGLYQTIKEKVDIFPSLVKKSFAEMFDRYRAKLWSAGVKSIIYIFLTKLISVVILEVPAIRYFGEEINYTALGINIAFPSFLLFLVIIFTKVSSPSNTAKVVEGVVEIVFEEKKRKDLIVLRKPFKRGAAINSFFGFIYFLTYFVSFGAVIWALDKAHFNWVSITIFLFFLALVSFFFIRIRRSVQQLVIVDDNDNLFNFLFNFFCVPVIAVGKWLASNFSKINVFVFVMDFIIETPFKVFVEIAEQWTKYVKERKDDVV